MCCDWPKVNKEMKIRCKMKSTGDSVVISQWFRYVRVTTVSTWHAVYSASNGGAVSRLTSFESLEHIIFKTAVEALTVTLVPE